MAFDDFGKLKDGKWRLTRLPGLGWRDRLTGAELVWIGAPHSCWILRVGGDEHHLANRWRWQSLPNPPHADLVMLGEVLTGMHSFPKERA